MAGHSCLLTLRPVDSVWFQSFYSQRLCNTALIPWGVGVHKSRFSREVEPVGSVWIGSRHGGGWAVQILGAGQQAGDPGTSVIQAQSLSAVWGGQCCSQAFSWLDEAHCATEGTQSIRHVDLSQKHPPRMTLDHTCACCGPAK